MAAVIKKKGELAMEAEQYALSELQKATESIKCEYSTILRLPWYLNFPLSFLPVIALNLSEENK
jgi:hypothetical protein